MTHRRGRGAAAAGPPGPARSAPAALRLALAVALAACASAALAASAQEHEKGRPPRTPHGQPDLQGVWNYSTQTPLERPPELADRATLTPEETAAWNRRIAAQLVSEESHRDDAPAFARLAYNHRVWFEWDDVLDGGRTSLVVDPPDGRIPAARPAARARRTTAGLRRARPAQGPEDRGAMERCLLAPNTGPPMTPLRYNNNVQIFQTAGHVAILNEMVHDARIAPLDGRPHLAPVLRQWAGDSRASWDGETLVVTTRNFRGPTALAEASPGVQLVERFTRSGPDTLDYEFTVRDPAAWAGPWTALVHMKRSAEPLYEYACHEGNYAMINMLSGARAGERGAAGGAEAETRRVDDDGAAAGNEGGP